MDYLRWLGHAAFELVMGGKRILIDPWIEGNPMAPIKPDDITAADLILVTHDHGDHLGQTVELARRTGAQVVAIYELAEELGREGVKTVGMNVGGPARVLDLEIYMVPALHSSNRGAPVGFIIRGPRTVYHAGDTGLFGDIKLYAELVPIDYALVPIGGHFTMDPAQAALFVSLFRPRYAIPMHYNTFPLIRQDPKAFAEEVRKRSPGTEVLIPKPGESVELR